MQNAHNPSGPRHTLQAGLLALIPVDNKDQFYLQPEVVYYGAGETGREKAQAGKVGYDAVYANNYISVPVYLKGYFSEAESEFFGMFGPRFNFLINQKVTKPAKQAYTIEGDQYANGKAAAFGWGLGAGIGYSYKRKLELTGRFDAGISNTYPGLMTENGADPNIQKKKSQHVVSLNLSYIFD